MPGQGADEHAHEPSNGLRYQVEATTWENYTRGTTAYGTGRTDMTPTNYPGTKLQRQETQEKETDVLAVRVSCSDQEGWNELVGLLWVQSDWTPDT